jgi:hypothetical protein
MTFYLLSFSVTVELMLSLYNMINPILSWKLVMVLFFFKLYLLDVSNITMCVCVFSYDFSMNT